MKKTMWIMASIVVVMVLGTYLVATNTGREEAGTVNATNVRKLVEDISTGKESPVSASIDAKQLIVTDQDKHTTTYDLPQDDFFLSIAPYVAQTHPCEIHSLTGCQGEMINEQFSVTIHDSEGNSFMKESVMKSGANGFMDMWLPRDRTYLIRVVHNGKVAETQLSTYEKDNTCITTMQLS
ncbi:MULTISPECIES: CueP family metal-binding protein [unclassified Paenibacillus]|uniref:CueP family metal-binding protein n=1 Tax=unclassified Paenibacillus TaxID=185978 RepID=UPI000FE1EAD0|nr:MULTISPECIES: CueP family metal-binding protein [unclassified Paenibacillus]MCM3170892.1 CueP family metal-binding protein [Paenibacillus sp. MER 99-2]